MTDNRSHMYWLDDDLACRTVADRVAMYKKHLKDKFASYEREHDRVRLVEDTKGQGRADKATVFADGFNDAADGIGAGVLARNGKVWYTCIPDLWLLQDTKGTGQADVKKSLHTGYGVHVAFIGHDLHGLRFGPDGKLYFSIGDRGLNVEHRRQDDLRARHRRGAALQSRRLGAGDLRHRPAQPAGAGLRRVRQPLHRRQQRRRRRRRPAGSTSSRAATAAGASATSTCPGLGAVERRKALAHAPTEHRRRTSCRRSPTSPTARPA